MVRKSVVDSFGTQNPPPVSSRLITISADEQTTNTVTQLQYCVPLRGVNPNDMELYLMWSLEDGKYYFIVYWTLYTYLFFLIIVSITILVANESIPTQRDIGITF